MSCALPAHPPTQHSACVGCPPLSKPPPPLQVHLAGDEWLLRNVDEPPVLRYRVRVGGEYSAGGEALGPGSKELSFTATCLTRL